VSGMKTWGFYWPLGGFMLSALGYLRGGVGRQRAGEKTEKSKRQRGRKNKQEKRFDDFGALRLMRRQQRQALSAGISHTK